MSEDVCIFDGLRDEYKKFGDFYDDEQIENLITKVEDILNLHGKVFEIGEALNKTGFTIFETKLDSNTSGIFASSNRIEKILGKGRKKAVLINKDNSLEKQRFTMAHELGHYIFDYNHGDYISKHGSDDADSREERRASRFAAALLMKKNEFIESLNKLKDIGCDKDEILNKLAIEYCVPKPAVVKRIDELKLQL